MIAKVAQILLGLMLSLLLFSPDASSQSIPSSPGWYEIPNTALQSVCPPDNFGGTNYPFSGMCKYVVWAWNSGVLDTARNRLIVWGGGHADYLGNEVYAVNLS